MIKVPGGWIIHEDDRIVRKPSADKPEPPPAEPPTSGNGVNHQ
jgi:hypothetical protein